MNIIDFIPEGKKNAVTREQLCMRTGLSDRKVRDEIARARINWAILNLSDGKGYYRPIKEDYVELRRYKKQEENRLRSISKGLKQVNKLLIVSKSENIDGQMDMFAYVDCE